jgi:adenylate cyclase
MENGGMEIERKFLIRVLPDLSGCRSFEEEVYYLAGGKGVESRLLKRGDDWFALERKDTVSRRSRTRERIPITREGFDFLRKFAPIGPIERTLYYVSENPEITVRVYSGKLSGFARAEVSFRSEAAARSFSPPDWLGKEITGSALGKDRELMKLGKAEIRKLSGKK